ncbi:MAG: aminopeptidase, partial [Gammaproteobacteria bacterium]|nr:aminopeptidase [Gammaproteobacteria bacterium]
MPERRGRTDLKRVGRVLGAVVLATFLCGCTTLGYYRQAVSGHLDVMNRRTPIDGLIGSQDTTPELKRKLSLVVAAVEFAMHELKLPNNGSYRSYADLERDYVVWNVFAAPELSLDPVPSCFLFVGCLSYRGFFDEAQALEFGQSLRATGNDVFVGGVAAYSTLGWFDDPVLNTMLVWDDVRIVKVIFHELAHQRVYAEDDTVFNESFATTVAQIGVERWLSRDDRVRRMHFESEDRESQFFDLLLTYRTKLEAAYASTEPDEAKRAQKKQLFDELSARYRELRKTWNGYDGYDEWMGTALNNAKLASIAAYHDYVPAFRSILNRMNHD